MPKIRLSDLPQLLKEGYIKPEDEYPIEAGVAARIYTAYENSRKREEALELKVASLELRVEFSSHKKAIYG